MGRWGGCSGPARVYRRDRYARYKVLDTLGSRYLTRACTSCSNECALRKQKLPLTRGFLMLQVRSGHGRQEQAAAQEGGEEGRATRHQGESEESGHSRRFVACVNFLCWTATFDARFIASGGPSEAQAPCQAPFAHTAWARCRPRAAGRRVGRDPEAARLPPARGLSKRAGAAWAATRIRTRHDPPVVCAARASATSPKRRAARAVGLEMALTH